MKINDETEFLITRQESHFDRACDLAYKQAHMYFGIDEDGHSDRIEMRFLRYTRIGSKHYYEFSAKVTKYQE